MEGNELREFHDYEREAPEVQLVRFARSEYAKELVRCRDYDKFIEYCLNNIYHTSIKEIVSNRERAGDETLEWYVLGVGVALVGIVVVLELVVADEPGDPDGPAPVNISKAAFLCGGEEFNKGIVNRLVELIQADAYCGVN